jgi:putative cell wall-binding protein
MRKKILGALVALLTILGVTLTAAPSQAACVWTGGGWVGNTSDGQPCAGVVPEQPDDPAVTGRTALFSAVHLEGVNRFHTANLAATVDLSGAGSIVYVVNAHAPADQAVAAALASRFPGSILYVERDLRDGPDRVDQFTRDGLVYLAPDTLVFIGGHLVISPEVRDFLVYDIT